MIITIIVVIAIMIIIVHNHCNNQLILVIIVIIIIVKAQMKEISSLLQLTHGQRHTAAMVSMLHLTKGVRGRMKTCRSTHMDVS